MVKVRRGSEVRKKRKRVRANKFCEKGYKRYEESRKKRKEAQRRLRKEDRGVKREKAKRERELEPINFERE